MLVFMKHGYQTATLAECMAMSPVEMAGKSAVVKHNYAYLLAAAGDIRNSAVRQAVLNLLHNPAPTFLCLYNDQRKRQLHEEFILQGFIDESTTVDELIPPCSDPYQALQPFWSAPGSDYPRHHCYPGGLVNHTAFNLRSALSLCRAYQETYGHQLDLDVVIASQILHDAYKTWILQWRADGSCLPQFKIAAAGAHHIFGLAESLHRNLPAEIILAQACTHNHPGNRMAEQEVIGWLKLACLIVGKDPLAEGLLAADGQTLPLPRKQELFVAHLGDHSWILSVPAAKWIIDLTEEIALEDYHMNEEDLSTVKFHSFRNYIFSQAGCMHLYQILIERGRQGFQQTVGSIIPK